MLCLAAVNTSNTIRTKIQKREIKKKTKLHEWKMAEKVAVLGTESVPPKIILNDTVHFILKLQSAFSVISNNNSFRVLSFCSRSMMAFVSDNYPWTMTTVLSVRLSVCPSVCLSVPPLTLTPLHRNCPPPKISVAASLPRRDNETTNWTVNQ